MKIFSSKNNKSKAFSLGYAIVALVIVAISVASLTPVLTRKLSNVSGVGIFGNSIKGWYESYNAPATGTLYCKTCKENDENNKPWPDKPQYDTSIGDDEEGNPEYNPYVKDPEQLVPFERYCTDDKTCGYPEDKWDEDEYPSTLPPDKKEKIKKRPHKCKNGKCKFKPTKGVRNYNMFAVGSGGASGSAIKQNETNINLVGAAGPVTTKYGEAPSQPAEYNIVSDFIDRYKVIDDDSDINKSSARGHFFTVGEVSNDIKYDHISNGNGKADLSEQKQANFHAYPTSAWNEDLSKQSSKQVERILKDLGKDTPKNIIYRFYLYTIALGADKYQDPVYTLMPEWLKMDGKESRYPNIPELPKPPETQSNPPDESIPNPTNPVIDTYNYATSVACSGDGGMGGGITCKNNTEICDWMKVKHCPRGSGGPNGDGLVYDEKPASGSLLSGKPNGSYTYKVGCNSSCGDWGAPPECYNNVSKRETHLECQKKDPVTNVCLYSKRVCDYKVCQGHGPQILNRTCTYDEYNNGYVICTCQEKKLPDICYKVQKDVNETCYPETVDKVISPSNDADAEEIAKAWGEALRGSDFEYTDASGNKMTKDDIFNLMLGDGSVLKVRSGESVAAKLMSGLILAQFVADLKEAFGLETEDVQANLTQHVGGGEAICNTRLSAPVVRRAGGGTFGKGICVYRLEIIEKDKLKSIESKYGKPGSNASHTLVTGAGCGNGNDGGDGGEAKACINDICRNASGGTGGKGGKIGNICTGSTSSGANGSIGTMSGSGNGGQFKKPVNNSKKLRHVEPNGTPITGTKRNSGMYNWHYVWYLPVVTKHLMFGTSGSSGMELKDKISLDVDETLEVKPGGVAKKTDYKSGVNGENGKDSTVNIINQSGTQKSTYKAQGGKGGLANIKTNQYLLCHVADLQDKDINKPCYYKDSINNDFKKTHKIDKDGKFTGIQAINSKKPETINNIPLSAELRKANPGMGAMGFGTESVSDVICEKRHLDKVDDAPQKDVISAGGEANSICNGNTKIRYILPNSTDYSSGTGIVVISW